MQVEPRAAHRAGPAARAARRRRRPWPPPRPRAARGSASAGRSGCSELGRPSAAPCSATGGGAQLRPRPAGRSGWVSTSATSSPGPRRAAPAPRAAHAVRACEADAAATASVLSVAGPAAAAGPPCASRRASGVVRSMISTPSRWSISCWARAPRGPRRSTRTGSPVSSRASTDHARGRARRARARGPSERQPSSVGLALVAECSTIVGVDERHAARASSSGAVDEHAPQRDRPGWPRGRRRGRPP